MTRILRALALAALVTLGPAGADPGTERDVEVAIVSPQAVAVFGPVEVIATVQSPQPVVRAEIWLDGRLVETITKGPLRATVDAGDENRSHRFEVRAYTGQGSKGSAEVVTPRLKIDDDYRVDLRQLYVTVTRDGERVLDLDRDDLRVFEDGHEQKLVTFERGDVPLTAVLMLDSSESMHGGRLQAALRGARAFASGMKELDEAMLMLFSDRALRATPFTATAAELDASLAGVVAAGGTAINDHLFLALELLDGRQGRRVVVLFSDGGDLLSVLGMREVLWKAQRGQSLIYWLRLAERGANEGNGPSSAWRNAAANRAELELLEDAIAESGGRIETLASIDDLEPAFRGILEELRGQYVLGYYSNRARHDGSWREVEVKVRRGGGQARTRSGYTDY